MEPSAAMHHGLLGQAEMVYRNGEDPLGHAGMVGSRQWWAANQYNWLKKVGNGL